MNVLSTPALKMTPEERAGWIFRASVFDTHHRTDRLFAGLMAVQWLAGIAIAFLFSPKSWAGSTSSPHIHVWISILGGALVMGPPVLLAIVAPGRTATRHMIAIGQMLESALLIHLTGGRIETHFHVFGSLAFLSFYRDWKVLLTGSVVVAADHFLRGAYWPQSVYGVLFGADLRWLEHAGWVAFIDAFLIRACVQSLKEMRETAFRQARLEAHQADVEREVVRRTGELRESEEKFRQMAENIEEVFWMASPDLSKMYYVSPAYEKIWGRSLAELMEHPESWVDAIHPEDRERVWKLASAHQYTGTYEVTYRILRPDGSIRWLYDHGSTIRNEAGDVVRLAGSVVDITHLKAIEENLVRSNMELERFAYVASHDLQEPLRSVSSFLQLLQRRYKGRLDADADEYIRFAVDGAHRMKELIGDLLAYSRLNTQASPVERSGLDGVLDIALENLKGAVAESRATVTRDPLPEVMVDGAQFAQVFQNLISNAIKFRGERAPKVHVRAERIEGAWTIRVADNGIGIESQYAERIFVIFQRLNGQKYPGTGIGLTICKKIVERHRGRIWMNSTPGEGTTFSFTIPDAVEAKAPPPAAPSVAPRVLVVDEDPAICALIRKKLSPLGMTVEEAHSGREGLELAARLIPDLLVLDAELPGQLGMEVYRALKRDPATRFIPVVMITGRRDLLDPEMAASKDWFPKPLPLSDFRIKVQALVAASKESPD